MSNLYLGLLQLFGAEHDRLRRKHSGRSRCCHDEAVLDSAAGGLSSAGDSPRRTQAGTILLPKLRQVPRP